jgi:hypothetical protein
MFTAFQSQGHAQSRRNASAEQAQYVQSQEDSTFSGHYPKVCIASCDLNDKNRHEDD